nr:MAG TPA_asm: hypothetical protein [Caudoviricetes sp.]
MHKRVGAIPPPVASSVGRHSVQQCLRDPRSQPVCRFVYYALRFCGFLILV